VKTFDISILPPATRINIDRLDLVVAQPLLDFSGDKFGAIVTADKAGLPLTESWPAPTRLRPQRR
jgi:hypothetical protein